MLFSLLAMGAMTALPMTPQPPGSAVARAAFGGTLATLAHGRRTQTEIPIDTNTASGWAVAKPGSSSFKAVKATAVNGAWESAQAGSEWIATGKRSGVERAPGGYFDYRFTFCAALPPSVGSAFISLSVLADNAFDVVLNGNDFDPTPFANYGENTPFQMPQTVSTSSFFSQSGPNILDVVVENQRKTPTGVDVSGYVDNVEPSC